MEKMMPLVCEFNGIKIYFYWNEHAPPHFHAEYGESHILVNIQDASVMKGAFPFKQLKLVLAWSELHEGELMENWRRAEEKRDILRIEPLR
jgi:hypothetical protein